MCLKNQYGLTCWLLQCDLTFSTSVAISVNLIFLSALSVLSEIRFNQYKAVSRLGTEVAWNIKIKF